MKRTADRLFGDQYHWSVLGAGRNQMPIASMSAAMGGHVRVGLEDSLWLGPGKLAESNAAQVRAVRDDHRRAWASRSPRPTTRARSSSSRARPTWGSDHPGASAGRSSGPLDAPRSTAHRGVVDVLALQEAA